MYNKFDKERCLHTNWLDRCIVPKVRDMAAVDGRRAMKQDGKGCIDLVVASKTLPLNYSKVLLCFLSSCLVDILIL